MHRAPTLAAASALTFLVGCQTSPPTVAEPRLLPGARADGFITLSNQWSLKPAGKQVPLGDFPVNMALHPTGNWLAVLHAGQGQHDIRIFDVKRQKVVSEAVIDQAFYGLCFSPDGRRLYVSGGEFEVVHGFDFADGYLSGRRQIAVVKPTDKFIPAGIATDAEGKRLFVAGPWGDAVAVVSADAPTPAVLIPLEKGSYPYAVVAEPTGKRLYVSLWNKAGVAVIDLAGNTVAGTWATEAHPTEMALTADGKTLYVACANSTQVSVVDTATGRGLETISCALYPKAPSGNTPNSLTLTPDGKLLFVANADANNLAVFNVEDRGRARPLGFIPTGWYPTSVRFNRADNRLYIANGKGTMSQSNPQGPNPGLPANATIRQYIASLFRGTLGVVDLPTTTEQMAAYSKTAYACSPLREDHGPTAAAPAGNPIPAKLGGASPIRHCIYIIKENRTYDQVFGDMKEGNGDPSLCLFPESVTPNHHKLAREFVLLDNLYCDGEVSADGHEWSMGAYATDFVEKVWPLTYRPGASAKRKLTYPAEGQAGDIATPAGGYIWDRAAEAKVTYRSYGEWIDNGKTPADPGVARAKALEGHFDPMFRGYDMDYPDVKRAERFIQELKRFEAEGEMPRLMIVRLPNDHTYGTRVGKPTPAACVADNDLALGRIIEAVTNSRFWKDTAVFVIEDDAQNGSDHVDAHRTVGFVISPYTKRRHVDSTMYSTASLLRTMELILGLRPMSQFDAAARPMYNSFTDRADFRPYRHEPVDEKLLAEKNTAVAFGAKLSETFDFSREDAVDDLVFSEVIWKAVRGADSPMPPPVRAAFVFPHLKDKKDDD